jgi:hypothetical protein
MPAVIDRAADKKRGKGPATLRRLLASPGTFADDAGATSGAKALEGILSTDLRDRVEGIVGKEFADSISIDRDHAVTRVSATLSSDEVDRLLAMTRLLL